MATAIRLARAGAKKRPFYRLVATDSRSPRDGDFLEKLGTYQPQLPKDSNERFKYNAERVKYWLGVGAQPSEVVARFLRKEGLVTSKPVYTPKPKTEKLPPRAAARKAAEEEAKNAASEAKAQPQAEAPAAEVPAAEPAAAAPEQETPAPEVKE